MTDPVERVARALAKYNWSVEDPDFEEWFGRLERFDPVLRTMLNQQAEDALEICKAWLTEQGVPIDKLLSGEMVARPDPNWGIERKSGHIGGQAKTQ